MNDLVDLYLRLSVDRDGKDSLERQEKDLRAWAKREKLTVRTVWKDAGRSGYKKVERKAFDNAVRAVTSGEVGTLAVWKLDRLSRRGAGQVGLVLDKVEEVGGRIFFLRDSLESTVPGHRMVILMVSEQARAESANTSVRVRAKIASDAAEGIPKRGVRPFGWEKDGITIREPEAAVIRSAYAAVKDGTTLWSLARQWTAAGVKTDGMGRLRQDRTRPDEKRVTPAVWTATTVRQVLTRARNAGILMLHGERMKVSKIKPIVTEEEHEALLSTLAQRAEAVAPAPGPKPQYLLGGILECICGERMHATISYSQKKGGKRRKYQVYVCRARATDKTQKHTAIQLPLADDAVAVKVLLRIFEGDVGIPSDEGDLDKITSSLADNTRRTEHATSLLLDPDLKAQHSRIKAEIRSLEALRASLEADRDRILASRAEGGAFVPLIDAWNSLPAGSMTWEKSIWLTAGMYVWENLMEMDKRREVVKGLFRIKVKAGGRGPQRLEFTRL